MAGLGRQGLLPVPHHSRELGGATPLKRAIMHCRNSLFYRSATGARARDTFMSLIHSAELNGVEPFEYLIELLKHSEAVD